MDPLLDPKSYKFQTIKGFKAAQAATRYREPATVTIGRWANQAHEAWRARPMLRRAGVSALAVLLCASAAMAVVSLRPRPVPDVFDAQLDDVLDYTLVSDDFNKLSVDERLRLLKELMRRLRGMESGDSAMMAAFAAGITGKARAQLQKNAERLMVDVWDKFAKDYTKVEASDRKAYLDQAAIDFAKLMEDLGGVTRDVDDDTRLREMRRQAKRDESRMPGPATPINPEAVGGFVNFVNRIGQNNTSPAQRDRMAEFGRDMTRHLRGYRDPNAQPNQPAPGQPEQPASPDQQPPAPPPDSQR
jgi:hypothetical protein